MKCIKRLKEHYNIIYVFLMTAIICLVDGQYFRLDSFAVKDEFSIMATAAYYAGMDWSDVVANTSGWHGYGAVILLTPLFWFVSDGILMYKLCLLQCLIFRIATAIICYFLVSGDLELPPKYAFGIALVCDLSNLSPDDGNALSALTEVPFNFFAVLIIFLSVKMLKTHKKNSYILSIIIGFLLVYMLTIHSRGIVYIGVYLVAMLIVSIKNRKHLVYYGVEWLTVFVSYFFYKIVNGNVILDVYTSETMVGSVKNTAENTVSTGIDKLWRILTNWDEFYAVIKTTIGLAGSFNAFSYGAVVAFTIVIIAYYVKVIRKRENYDETLFLITCVGMFGFWGMNFLLAIKNAYNVANGVSFLAYTYMRYAYPFASVFLIGGIVCAYRKSISKNIIWLWMVLSVLILKWYLTIPLKDIKNLNGGGFQYYSSIKSDFYLFLFVSFVVGAICVHLIRYKKIGLVMYIYIVIGLFYFQECFGIYENKADKALDGTMPSVECVNIIEEQFEEEMIYITFVGSKKYPQLLRILCPRSELKYINKENVSSIDFSNAVLFVDNEETAKSSGADYAVSINSGVWLATDNEELLNVIEEYVALSVE